MVSETSSRVVPSLTSTELPLVSGLFARTTSYLTTAGSQEWLNSAKVGKRPPPKKTDVDLSTDSVQSVSSSDISWALN